MTRRCDIFGAVAAALVAAAASCSHAGGSPGGGCDVGIEDAQCTEVRVPENRANPGRRAITLRVVVLPALAAARLSDPVVYLAGGPGQAASDLIRIAGSATALRQRRDLVFADQRGTGGSGDLRCPFYRPDAARFDDFMPIARVRECRDRLQSSADLAQYTTAASVADLDAVRQALGYETMNLVGGSYGTRLGLEYLRQHGARVRTITLEGVVPPGLSIPERFGTVAQTALDGVIDECLADASCGARFPDLKHEAAAVFDRLRNATVPARLSPRGDPPRVVTLSREHVAEAVRYMLYSSREASRLPSVLHAAYAGDFSRIAQFLSRWRGSGTFDGLYLSITCAEDLPFVASNAAERDDPTFLGGYRVRQQRAACAEWPRGAVPAWHREPVTSTVPALLVSGTLDPVTPPSIAEEVARTLPNSLHVRVPSGGHDLDGLRGLECIDRLRAAFIERGSVADLDVSCVRRVGRSGFDP
jgi:pimeloyl-ACP methyl ester carboxylesterase